MKHAYLGVSIGDGTVTVDGAQRQAAVIGAVTAGTPAARSRAAWPEDAVVALDGRTIGGAESLIAQVGELSPGTSVRLTVVRSGRTSQIEVTVAARPRPADGPTWGEQVRRARSCTGVVRLVDFRDSLKPIGYTG